MLKIRDDVDLKELEKFGFAKHMIFGYVIYGKKNGNFIENKATVNLDTRTLWISQKYYDEVINLLKDLIVEVGDDND